VHWDKANDREKEGSADVQTDHAGHNGRHCCMTTPGLVSVCLLLTSDIISDPTHGVYLYCGDLEIFLSQHMECIYPVAI
jgi:hypothetical protein